MATTDVRKTPAKNGMYGAGRFKAWLLLTLVMCGVAGLASAGASSANISHSYQLTDKIPNGSIVSLDTKRTDYVQLANTSNGDRLVGVAVGGDDSLIAVDLTPGAVQVATSGDVSVLVSTVNGDINVGDQIAVSPLGGTGMRALPGSRIIGLAQTAFTSSTAGAVTEQIKDNAGTTRTVQVGYIRAGIAISTNIDAAGGGGDLTGLQKLAKSITGRTVSNTRVIISLVIAVIALLALVTLIYASIYGSIISIGRNPLAKYAVFRTLGAVIGLAALTTAVAGFTLFLLLR